MFLSACNWLHRSASLGCSYQYQAVSSHMPSRQEPIFYLESQPSALLAALHPRPIDSIIKMHAMAAEKSLWMSKHVIHAFHKCWHGLWAMNRKCSSPRWREHRIILSLMVVAVMTMVVMKCNIIDSITWQPLLSWVTCSSGEHSCCSQEYKNGPRRHRGPFFE